MQDAPSFDDYTGRMEAVCSRAEALETTTDRRLHEHAVAEAVAGPEAESNDILVADGGETPSTDEPLHVGDHVQDQDDPDATMVVMRVCEETAGEYQIDGIDESVAEYNGVSDGEGIYQVVYASRTDKDLADCKRYPFPRSRLELVAAVHDRDDAQEVSE